MQVNTRVCHKVVQFENPEIRCTICEQWKSTLEFGIEHSAPSHPRAMRFARRCKLCDKLRSKMATKLGHFPSHMEVKQAIGNPLSTSLFGALNQARHPKRESQSLSKEELKLLNERRDKREKKNKKPDLVYLVGAKNYEYVKIGHSRDPWARLGDIQPGNPLKLEVIATMLGGESKERELHTKFFRYHGNLIGEWFNRAPAIFNEFSAGKVK